MLAPPSSGAVRRATWCWGSQQQPAPTSVSGPSPPPPVRLPVATPAPPSTASSPPWSSCTRWGRGWGSSATPATSPRPWTSWSVGSRETGQLASPHVRTSSSNSSSSSYSTSLSRTYLISDSYQNITTAQCYISLINQQGRFVGRSREHFLYCLLIFVWNVNKSSLVIIVFFVLVVTGLLWSGNIWSELRKHWGILFQTCEEIMDRSSVLITPEKCYITHYNTQKHTEWSVQFSTSSSQYHFISDFSR